MLSKRIGFEVTGYVQGVGFRRYVERTARELGGITGFVYNTKQGTVRGEAQTGSSETLELFVQRLKRGSTISRVEKVEVREMQAVVGETGFTIKKTV
ncbi:Acylphosphatase-like domain-containing protein [Myxozyma melibiosi]|uniref:acylphosphatase n=1 Tax=Myxozyma melibiosi TaxID=54550 RepID=A0ABR1FFE8_9ASCO